ncbi:MAG: neutral zinc metallopeptidase [Sedimentisphaerales bacterium]|jgi:predicted metalloprotease|nr:neutral zinc metallopeptidase [Sedimentisphaerales bacterium]NLZ03574.1 metalloprotease [Phycisphaerae bacterium]HNY78086.1 neutral zinc metallopeptidase [Sedimentisphaerales bacterium]HOC63196.1 neutral zinc metallopeptidase [Sedimentisphaerales bacterium]HOH64261.1 neutral zinc metallopeptidase [Sedimentisphaerales bacterium]
MRWKDRRASSNVEDRRGLSVKQGMVGGGLGTLILVLAIYFLGGNPSQLLNSLQMQASTDSSSYVPTAEENELAQFVSVVLAETENVWTDLFRQQGLSYEYPKLVLYTGTVQTGSGYATSATGPFYAPGDRKVYIDLSFYQELQQQFHAPGDFAMAYVIAHEVGHHVQTLLGITEKVMSLRSGLSETQFNKYMVCFELQADYLAGVWAHYADRVNLLEAGDLDEALNAASAVGDDRIQKAARGYVVPDSFTHGTSEQRRRWFHKGFTAGTLRDADTFAAEGLSLR